MFAQIFRVFKDFAGDKVPRDADGKWTKLRFEHGKGWVGHDKPLTSAQQAQLKKVPPVPPAWVDVHLNPNPQGDTQIKARDASGKQQIKQHPEAIARNADVKWARVKQFHKTAVKLVMDAAVKGMTNKKLDETSRDIAAVVHLVSQTGFRIGSDVNTGAQDQAYGASTLQKKHISVKGDVIKFNFTGKSGVTQQKQITDPLLAPYLTKKLASLKPSEQVFTATDAQARAFIKESSGDASYKAKDFRTWHGTGLALMLRKSMKPPTTAAEYKQRQNEIADKVSQHLGNTRAVALSSYISPAVWSKWDPTLAPKKKEKVAKNDDPFDPLYSLGFSHVFLGEMLSDATKITKEEMPSFQDLWDAMEEAVNDPEMMDEITKDDLTGTDLKDAGAQKPVTPLKRKKVPNNMGFAPIFKDSEASKKAWLSRPRIKGTPPKAKGRGTPQQTLTPQQIPLTPDNTPTIAKAFKEQAKQHTTPREHEAVGLIRYMLEDARLGTEGTDYEIHARMQGAKMASAIEFHRNPGEIKIDLLASLKKGEGSHWIAKVEALAKKEKRKVVLEATPGAVTFYKALGYKAHGTVPETDLTLMSKGGRALKFEGALRGWYEAYKVPAPKPSTPLLEEIPRFSDRPKTEVRSYRNIFQPPSWSPY